MWMLGLVGQDATRFLDSVGLQNDILIPTVCMFPFKVLVLVRCIMQILGLVKQDMARLLGSNVLTDFDVALTRTKYCVDLGMCRARFLDSNGFPRVCDSEKKNRFH